MRGTRGEPLGEEACVRVVVGKAGDVSARAHAAPRAAKMPTCRIAPPSMRRWRPPGRSARGAGEERPAGRAEPLGERDRDEFERRGEPVSTPSPLATAAFQSRAPSRKVAMPRSRAAAQMRPPRRGKTTPPARLCVFSISTRVVGG
jgi:hypothetical protein